MDGDLSLSQSLGGLRIANPDDPLGSPQDVQAAAIAPVTPEPVRKLDSTSNELPESSDLGPPQLVIPITGDSLGDPISSTHIDPSVKLPDDHRIQKAPYHLQQAMKPHSPTSSSRPLSAFFANGSQSTLAAREGSYRMRTDSGASSTSEKQGRIDARSYSAASQAGVPIRDGSHSDRSYRTAKIPIDNGPVVRRHPSRANPPGGGPSQLSGSPCVTEDGPLASSEEWQDRGAAVAVRQDVDANGKPITRYIKKGVRDFAFGNTLGEGSYSTVVLATDRQTLKEYAIKILDKRHIIKEKKVKYVNIEKDTLNRLTDHPGIVRLYYTFQDERSLYFVLDLCKGGELLTVLKRMSSFDEECTRFYGAQILDTIDYMHKCDVIHRDLKPENVLLDNQMYIKITDFGTAKILQGQKLTAPSSGGMLPLDSSDLNNGERASSFVGTAEYVSPELLNDKNACKASDLWAFGCIIFQLLAGRPPFKAGNEYQTFQKIVALDYEFPAGFPIVARDLIERLLVLDPAQRLQIEHIKNHEFFEGITWGRNLWERKPPRLKAYTPPPREPIKLNGSNANSFPPSISTAPSNNTNTSSRVVPRLVTELPPPSELDIEWSPVLTKNNERILKMGNLVVLSSPLPQKPTKAGNGEQETPKKFSRFFGGSTTKKRQRLVMVTSTARIIMVSAKGDEKKMKLEISLLADGIHYRSATDAKGFSSWIVETADKRFVFENPKPSNTTGTTAMSAQEWLDALDRAREIAGQNGGSCSADEAFRELSSGLSSGANTLDRNSDMLIEGTPGGRGTLVKAQPTDSDSSKAKKRFSRRHSRNGLSAVF